MIEPIIFKGLKDLRDLGEFEMELPPVKKEDLYFFKKAETTYIAESVLKDDNKQRFNFIIAYEVKK